MLFYSIYVFMFHQTTTLTNRPGHARIGGNCLLLRLVTTSMCTSESDTLILVCNIANKTPSLLLPLSRASTRVYTCHHTFTLPGTVKVNILTFFLPLLTPCGASFQVLQLRICGRCIYVVLRSR